MDFIIGFGLAAFLGLVLWVWMRSRRRVKENSTSINTLPAVSSGSNTNAVSEDDQETIALFMASTKGIVSKLVQNVLKLENSVSTIPEKVASAVEGRLDALRMDQARERLSHDKLAEMIGSVTVDLQKILENRLAKTEKSFEKILESIQTFEAASEQIQTDLSRSLTLIAQLASQEENASQSPSQLVRLGQAISALELGQDSADLFRATRAITEPVIGSATDRETAQSTLKLWGQILELAAGASPGQHRRAELNQLFSKLAATAGVFSPDGTRSEWQEFSRAAEVVCEYRFSRNLRLLVPNVGDAPDPQYTSRSRGGEGPIATVAELGVEDLVSREVLKKAVVLVET